ncbi:hypothetical protein AALP_AA4G172000 [Arabis alpina]|uniref:non-specific serine/threonine protein kinase n=1 Tax=Arabis alpina TaxID=50452 RepID=A0A087H3U3_ARAAL|nr:hypothetical protein AALP_AA4G172000 [Arabis alpina]
MDFKRKELIVMIEVTIKKEYFAVTVPVIARVVKQTVSSAIAKLIERGIDNALNELETTTIAREIKDQFKKQKESLKLELKSLFVSSRERSCKALQKQIVEYMSAAQQRGNSRLALAQTVREIVNSASSLVQALTLSVKQISTRFEKVEASTVVKTELVVENAGLSIPSDQIITKPDDSLKSNKDKSSRNGEASSAVDQPVPTPSTPPPPVQMANEEDANLKQKNMKRMASAGLQIESVLGRKTENLKEIYSVGRKLGQGQFGTTFLCIDKKSGGELFDRIIQRGHYTEKKAAELARIIVGVIEACHSLGVMHRDLKPENFLFVNGDEDAALKTIDFGLSVFFKPGETFSDVVGSPYYVAPEVLRKHYSHECDVWSAGVIIYILLSGVPPFWDETEQGIFEQVLKGDLDFISEPWPSISESAKDLVRRMLIRDPKKRMTTHEVLCHPWARVDGVALDKPLDSAVLSRLTQFSAMNKLKKIAIKVIAESLSEEEIAGLKEMFKMIDTDNSGHITLEELKKGLDRVGANLKDSEILGLMQAADIDNSGTIDYGEFIAAMVHLNKIEKEDHLFTAFNYFDKDGSGYITRDELQQGCTQFGLKDVHLDDILREVDKDNDGRIDYSEFVEMMQDTGFGKMGLRVIVKLYREF